MVKLQGKYNSAKVFSDSIEHSAIEQVEHLLNQEFVAGSKIRIMPDAHAGAGCTIGTTMTITDKVVPNLVGVDIGCGMETILLKDKHIELQQFDKTIHRCIPSGFDTRKKPHHFIEEINIDKLRCAKHVDLARAKLSIGTLGGGNHFIELGKDDDGQLYLVVHTGSRNLGKQTAEYYQNAAVKDLQASVRMQELFKTKNHPNTAVKDIKDSSNKVNILIAELKQQGRETEIQEELEKLRVRKVEKNLAFCEGTLLDNYLHDMALVQQYANWNRRAIVLELVEEMNFKIDDRFTTVHNYIDLDSMILRKGAISAQKGERVLIPMNMRDGSLICIGKGNEDWNYSAPHGAGRIMSRTAAKGKITLTEFEKAMTGIYSSTVNKSTIDEAPSAYKPMEEIIANIGDTVDIVKRIKPLYNFKAAE